MTIRHDTHRIPKAETVARTKRRIANAEKAVRRELDSTPLFPELARFTSAEERLDQQERMELDRLRKIRHAEAEGWFLLRRRLLQLDPGERASFLDYWNASTMIPAESSYALDSLFNMFPRLDWYVEDMIRIGGPAYDTPAERERMKETFERLFAKGQAK